MKRPETNDYRQLFLQDVPLIDTRAPVEFTRGAFPNAVNLPLMDDEERRQVGIRYKQAGQDAAIALGRELVTPEKQAQRTRRWHEFAQANPHGYLYCFRGGLRSRISQTWLAESGIDYPYVSGGYKAMRRFLLDAFAERLPRLPLVLISGRTGTGKTGLLQKLDRYIDLEALAAHRGSSFGKLTESQPTPVNFENALSIAMLKLTAIGYAPVFVEAEGRLIGRLCLPDSLWSVMSRSPIVVLDSPMEERIRIGIQDYVLDLLQRLKLHHASDDEAFDQLALRHRTSLQRIRKRLGGVRHKHAEQLLETALHYHREKNDLTAYHPFIELLLNDYYDPMYDYQLAGRKTDILFRGNADEILDWASHYLEKHGSERIRSA
ncbi:MAG: tRNA 2-selenouridine(34) synthase MnmH [Gammaproteobacteria bacterium]|nr:tRNA 2-selenouridine(34) synthase MnmH [Gammaproteobacteria bacterium]